MEIKDFLDPSHVMIDVRASDKARLLRELAGRAAAALDLSADLVSEKQAADYQSAKVGKARAPSGKSG